VSEVKDMLERMPLQYRAQIEAEVSIVWGMKRQAEEATRKLRIRANDLEAFILRNCDPFNMTKEDAAIYRGIQSKHTD